MRHRAPWRIETGRLVLRCYEGADAPALKEAVDTSLEHLRAFMEWAWDAPEPLEVVRERIVGFRRSFEERSEFVYGIFSADGSELLGGAGLHERVGPGALEIGYWMRASRLREGIATEAAAALTQVAFERCCVERVEIRIDPANSASLRIPAKLGFRHDGMLRNRLPPVRPSVDWHDAAIFSLLASEYPTSPSAAVELAEFDATGAAL